MADPISSNLSWTHFNPVRIVCDRLDNLASYVHGEKVILVTTPGFIKRGVVDRIKQTLIKQKVIVWDGVKPNPDLTDLDEATSQFKNLKPDCILGLGGGSALDASKILATTLSEFNGSSLTEVFRNGIKATWIKRLPLVVIPTTAGTGSEVTPFATIWDHVEKKKHSLSGNYVYPDTVLLDATLSLTLSRVDTLYPALDTVSHALESIWNINRTPMSAGYAYQSLRLVCSALPKILESPQELSLRKDLQFASVLSGLAISQTRTAIAHAISYPLTLYFGVPHGLACSFTLPYLIDKYIRSQKIIDSDNLEILFSVKSMILELNLSEEISKYMNAVDAIALIEGLELNPRVKNYSEKMESSADIVLESMN